MGAVGFVDGVEGVFTDFGMELVVFGVFVGDVGVNFGCEGDGVAGLI